MGAGMTGCMLANMLKEHPELKVTMFEKSHGCGGRASTKSLDWGTFDLGAAIVPAQDPKFIDFMQSMVEQNVAVTWPKTIYAYRKGVQSEFSSRRQHYVFNHKMTGPCRNWTSQVDLRTQSIVTQLRYANEQGWQVRINDIWLDEWFDNVVVSCPWPQTQSLLNVGSLAIDFTSYQQSWSSCWAVALKVNTLVSSKVDFAYLRNHSIQTLVRDSAKPGRLAVSNSTEANQHEIWVAHLGNALSDELGKLGKERATQLVIQEFCSVFDITESQISSSYAHYWRYARPRSEQLPLGVFSHPKLGLWATGDWSYGASIESAFLGASAVFQELVTRKVK